MMLNSLRQSKPSHRFLNLGLTGLLMCFLFQWEFLQIGAWTNMIRDYAKETTLKTAVMDTFSGEKPCANCIKLVHSQTGSDSDTAFTSTCSVLPEIAAPEIFRLPPGSSGKFRPLSKEFIFSGILSPRPPVPPPRFFFS